jgi:hypothetical protein
MQGFCIMMRGGRDILENNPSTNLGGTVSHFLLRQPLRHQVSEVLCATKIRILLHQPRCRSGRAPLALAVGCFLCVSGDSTFLGIFLRSNQRRRESSCRGSGDVCASAQSPGVEWKAHAQHAPTKPSTTHLFKGSRLPLVCK